MVQDRGKDTQVSARLMDEGCSRERAGVSCPNSGKWIEVNMEISGCHKRKAIQPLQRFCGRKEARREEGTMAGSTQAVATCGKRRSDRSFPAGAPEKTWTNPQLPTLADHGFQSSQCIDARGDELPAPPPPPPPPEPLRCRIEILESNPVVLLSLLATLARSGLVALSVSVPGSMCDLGNKPDLPLEFVPDQHQ